MNCKTMVYKIIVALFLIQLTNSQTITKVLQNKNGNYKGCKDSYTYSGTPDANFYDKIYISDQNCQT